MDPLKQAVHILMEGTPPEVDIGAIEKRLMSLPGVTAVRDLHVWTLTSGLDAMSCHLVVADMRQSFGLLEAASNIVHDEYKLTHTTIQIEDEAMRNSAKHETRV